MTTPSLAAAARAGGELDVVDLRAADRRTDAEAWYAVGRVVALHEVRVVPVPLEEASRASSWGMRAEDGGVGDLVAVEVQDRKDRSVRHRVEELVALPAARASGPVSASPSPTTQQTNRSGFCRRPRRTRATTS